MGRGDLRSPVGRVVMALGERRGRGREFFLAAHVDHLPGGRADDAVDAQPVAGLQAADGRLGFPSEVAIDCEMQRGLELADGAVRFAFSGLLRWVFFT